MTIETNYNLGDKYFYLDNNSIVECWVNAIKIEAYRTGEISAEASMLTKSNGGFWYHQKRLFKTREELIESL